MSVAEDMPSNEGAAKDDSAYVVYDCDIGTDDAWGLLMLIKGEKLCRRKSSSEIDKGPGKYKILGVTCVQGNTDVDNGSMNALRLLAAADRRDIPVYRGCSQPILPRTWERRGFFHGRNGFGDLEYSKEEDAEVGAERLQKEHAVNAMYEMACKHPKMVDFLLVGPLTNFATCIVMYGREFLDKIRHVYVMGGNYRGKGNITKSAEFNFMMDPEAAHIVLANVEHLVLLPWEPCIDGDFGITLDYRFNVLGANPSPVVSLLNRAERAILVPKSFVNWIVCDAILVASYLFPRQIVSRSRRYHATVELTGTHTRGQMVLDHLRRSESNVEVIMDIDKERYRNIIAWTAGVEELKSID